MHYNQRNDNTSDLVNVTIPAEVAAVIMAAASTALSRGDTIPSNIVAVITATVRATVPNARAITIRKAPRTERVKRVRYRKRPVESAWQIQGRSSIMNSHAPRR
jgi:hypothetical protein